MRQQERSGVRLGQRVVDVDGNDLGRVAALYDEAFRVVKGFPILFRREQVIRYDEVRGERDGRLVAARGGRDLFVLAAGAVPESWRVPAPRGFPEIAAPGEARQLYVALAAERRSEADVRAARARDGAAAARPRTEGTTPSPEEDSDAARRRELEPPSAHA
jgi:hypothetical protein